MRDFIAFCLLMSCFAVFVASLVALIRPLPKVWLGSRKRALGGFGVSFLLLILTAIVIPTPEDDEQSNEIAQEKAVVVPESASFVDKENQEDGIGVTVEEFKATFNRLSAELKRPWNIKNIKIEDNLFTYAFSNNIAMTGKVGAGGEIVSILIVGSGDGTAMSGLDIFSVMTAACASALNHDDMKIAGPLIMEMVEASNAGKATSKIMNDVKVSFARSDVLGNILTISPASE